MNTNRISTASTVLVLVCGSALAIEQVCRPHPSWIAIGCVAIANAASIATLVQTRRLNKKLRLHKMSRRLGVLPPDHNPSTGVR